MNESLPPQTGAEEPADLNEAVEATNRLIALTRETEESEGEQIPVTFHDPESAQPKLTAQEQVYSDSYDRLDSTRPFDPDLRAELARKGLRPAPTADEVEAQEEKRQAHLRQHASEVHKPKTSSSKVVWRPKGSNQRDSADADQRVKTARELRGDI
jgi:hypothetical protein